MAKSKEEKLAEIHAKALLEFNSIQGVVKPERLQCLQDRRFYSIPGAMYEGGYGEQFANKPKIEVNKVHGAVMRIFTDQRNNKITVDFISKDGTESKLSDVCDRLYRADEQDSCAEEAYDNAFEEAVGGGMGAWRYRTELEDEYDAENEKQRIRIEPIFDADKSVFFDLGSKRQDKSDARHCFVVTAYPRHVYIDEYQDDPGLWIKQGQSSFPSAITNSHFDWASPEVVYVAEYYVCEIKNKTVRYFSQIDGTEISYDDDDFDADEELEETLKSIGSHELRRKTVKTKRIHKYILSGGSVLEDCGYIAGNNIPIVVVYGKRWYIDNVERCMGHVRLVRDAQMLKNMQLSKLAEIAATSSVEKPIFTPEQVAGHGQTWANDNLENNPYLLINPIKDADGNEIPTGPVGYTKAPEVPAALGALISLTEQDIQDILGNPANAEKVLSNVSGEAIQKVQSWMSAMSSFYISNFAKGFTRGGAIWLGMARDVYVEPDRKMKAVTKQNAVESIELMKPMIGESGEVDYENDLSKASFDVKATVGPASASQKEAIIKSLTSLLPLTQDPADAQVLSSMILMNIEGEGIQDVRDYYRQKLVRMGVVKPTDDEKEQMAAEQQAQAQQQDPNVTYLNAMAQKAMADSQKAQADITKVMADAKLTEAKTVETLVDVSIKRGS